MKRLVLLPLFLTSALYAGISPGSKDIGAVWFIGDSITQSNADDDPNGSPRKSLYDLLMANGYTFSYTGHYNANTDGLPVSGGTAATNLYHYHSGISGSVIGNDVSGRTGMTQGLPSFWVGGRLATVKPSVILIMLGTNDVDQNIDLPNAPARLTTLLNSIYGQSGIGTPTIMVANIPPNRTDTPADPANVTTFNAAVPGIVLAQRALGRDVHFVDQFTPLETNYATFMRSDNLHTNTAGNGSLAQQWFTKIQELVGVPGSTITATGVNAALDTDNSPAAGMATAATYAGDISSSDLIDPDEASFDSAVMDKTPFGSITPGTAALNDGLGHPASGGSGTGAYLPVSFGSDGKMPFTYTANLDTSVNTQGYKITELRTFAGWNQNGSKLANQKYQLLVSKVGDAGFTSLGIFTYAPFGTGDTREAAATKLTLTDASGTIASNVDAVRLVFMDTGSNASIDGSLYHEVDVLGSPMPLPTISVNGVHTSLDTDNSTAAGMATAATYAADISSNDLIDPDEASFDSAVMDKVPFAGISPGVAGLNNGLGHPASGTGTGCYLPVTFGSVGKMPFTYTATLDTSVNALGYKITEIRSFAGWNQNGSKLANQKYELLVRTAGETAFISLGTFTYAPFSATDTTEAAASKMTLTDSSGTIATNVDAVRLVFMDTGINNGALGIDGSLYHEVDVIGAAVPVPPLPDIVVTGTNVSAETDNSSTNGNATASHYSADISATDLINAGQPSLASAAWDKTPFFESNPVNNGSGHPAASGGGTYLPATFGGGGKLPFTYTATLDTTANAQGYAITEIRSFAGWNQNGASLANQKYQVLVSTVGSPLFSPLGTFEYSPFDNASTQETGATKVVLTKNGGGVIASGVDAIRFVALDHGFNSADSGTPGIDGTVYLEFDVIGTAVTASGFASWASANEIAAEESGDGDGDGIPALVEYALGLDPKEGSVLPSLANSGTLTWLKGEEAAADPKISYAVRVSDDLDEWVAPEPGEVVESASGVTLNLHTGSAKRFARLEVTRVP